MRIAVDASSLACADNGIGRYLGCVLDGMVSRSAGADEWLLYGRGAMQGLDWPDNVKLRSDRLPVHLGRICSLAASMPWWMLRDRPDVFWGPAHRLPLWMPEHVARVVTIHDLCWLKVPHTMRASTRRLDALLMPRALRAADRIVAVSHATAAQLREAFPAVAGKVVVVHEAASPMPPPQSRDLLAFVGVDKPFVLFVGTAEPRKNLRSLLRAFAQATASDASVQLVIAGQPGWGAEDAMAESARLGLADRVVWLGKIDDGTLATLYRHALCLALPSLYEGFGLPLLEALAHGTPVLTSHHSAMPEVAGDAGLLVDPDSVDSITDGLRRLLYDTALRAQKASHATTHAARFSWDTAARETMSVLRQAVALRRPG